MSLLLLKASVLFAVTLGVARLLSRAPAVSRHRLWTLAFAAVLALPILAAAVPAVYVPIPSCCGAPKAPDAPVVPLAHEAAAPVVPATEGRALPSAVTASFASRQPVAESVVLPSARAALLTAWAGGAFAAAAALLLSLVRVRRLARAADRLDDAAWTRSAEALGVRLGLRRPARLFVSPAVGTPMAGGLWRPVIFLPSSARDWSDERRDVVLAHEIAHLAGHDPLRHVAARLAVSLYWFHPLAWIAARHAVAAREQACDDAVLALGTRPSAYARVLLDLADAMQPSAAGLGAISMVERSHLETRLMAILNDDPPPLLRGFGGAGVRGAKERARVIPAIAVALCTVLIAAAQPAVRASGASAAIANGPDATITVTTPAAASAAPALITPAANAERPAVLQANAGPESACWRELPRDASAYGYTSSRDVGGRTVITEQVVTSGSDRIIQKSFGDLYVCLVAEGAGARIDGERPSQWLGRARRVVIEARRGRDVERLEIAPYGTGQRVSWQVGGADRPVNAAAQQWRDRMLAVLDTTWEISSLRGEVSSLNGEISSIRGEESSHRGEISSLQGEVSSMRGRQSSVRGEESSLRGRISSIQGHVSSLRGAISSERGSISSLNAGGYRSADESRIRDLIVQHENAIARIEREIRDYDADAKVAAVERQIAALDADKKVAAIEADIRTFDLNGKVAAIERRITALDVDGKTAAIERQITALDVDRRTRELQKRLDDELKRLEAAIAAVR